jgi:hypothetical protein
MRLLLPLLAAVVLTSCSDAPTESKAKAPEKPLEPLTGRQAFQTSYPQARGWSSDAQPLRVRSMNMNGAVPPPGKAGVWEITYVSLSRQAAKIWIWSATEEGNIHKGLFAGPQQSWSPGDQERPFLTAAMKTDTDEALKEAIKQSADYLKKPGAKPPVSYLLDNTGRFPNPVWRVLWGISAGTAERQVFVDASLGTTVGKE